VLREDNAGVCEPEVCREYQQRQCNLSGRFLFFIPGIRSISAFELHTNSFYAMNAAIRKFETVAFLRGGRISGFLDRQRTPFYVSKTLMEVAHIDEHGRAVRVPQWIIDLEAPVDVCSLLRQNEDIEATLVQAQQASQILQSDRRVADAGPAMAGVPEAPVPPSVSPCSAEVAPVGGPPTLEQLMACVQGGGIPPELYLSYADCRWGTGWKLNPHGRERAWNELERYRHDPLGYLDKIASELQAAS
jgi:hypothetical protein